MNKITILHAVNPTFTAAVQQERVAVGSYVSEKSGEDAAHEAFHITNAPDEILRVSQKTLKNEAGLNRKRSLSIGDAVMVQNKFGQTEVLLCDSFGWTKI